MRLKSGIFEVVVVARATCPPEGLLPNQAGGINGVGMTPVRHTDTQTHRHTDTQTHRHTDTQTHRHTDTQMDTQTDTQPDIILILTLS
jgi:hypothetical protein